MKRLGSEISLFTDRFGLPRPWKDNWLAFSNGRAALAWFFAKLNRPVSVTACAYTCPLLVRFLRKQRYLSVTLCDVGVDWPWADVAIVPALFGSSPDVGNCAGEITIIDASQTAFGYEDFDVAGSGIDAIVLSGPRKCTELADGAILAMPHVTTYPYSQEQIAALPVAVDAASAKMVARGIWDRVAPEQWALWWNSMAEEKWPETPHRMSDQSKSLLICMDKEWHQKTRRLNADRLASWTASVPEKLLFWKPQARAPYCFPIFVGNQQELLAHLHSLRIFATALWPDAERGPKSHPNADWMARHLVSLPVDQRHDADDMKRVAKAVLDVAKPPNNVPDGMRRFLA